MGSDKGAQSSSQEGPAQTETTAHTQPFTAVNGGTVASGAASPDSGRARRPTEQTPSSPEEESERMNGIVHHDMSPRSSNSSPSVNGSAVRRLSDTPESPRSPPYRKRSWPEAFGDSERQETRRDSHNAEHHRTSDHNRGSYDEHDRAYERDRSMTNGHDPHAPLGQNYYPSRSQTLGDSEQRLAAEALHRESDSRKDYPPVLPHNEEPPRHHHPEYDRTAAGVQLDASGKRRKRIFSNRTKTGCMTCRKRKKKCDEQHPECNNCLRGGFVCEGYTARSNWQKPSQNKQPVHLASKDGPYHGSPAQQSQVQPPPPPQQQQQPSGPPPPPPTHYPDINDYGRRPELQSMDDVRRMSPRSESSRPPPNWSSGPPQYRPPHPPLPQKYPERPMEQQRPPMAQHENPHEIADPAASYPMTSAHLNQGGPPPPQSQHMTSQHQHPPPPHQGPPPPHSANPHQQPLPISLPPPSAVASPAQKRPSSHHRGEMSERDKMLRGEYYLPYTPALMADREQCALAVWQFNNSTNPSMGIPPEDRMKFFRQIFSLRPTHDPTVPPSGPHEPSPDPAFIPNGSVGTGVVVEAPFHCDYGYNVTIGNDVVIGADCRITDTCTVTIGNNVVFSPSVKLVCATYAIDPRERKKGKGRALGRQIIVEDDSWIGSNVTILPGVRVGRCSTVGAGSLLHKDVPPFTVVAGNPPKVVRGIYDDGSSRS